MTDRRNEVKEYLIDGLNDLTDYYTGYGADLHNELFNTDYYIIGTYQAEQWLDNDVFEIISLVKDYENDNFGEVITDISNPEKLVNMYVYILGEELLSKAFRSINECYNRHMYKGDFYNLIKELN